MKTHVDLIVKRTVLSNSDEDGLMVRSSVDGGEAVGASRETVGDVSSENTVLSSVVKTLEEGEDGGVSGGGLRGTAEQLDDDV